MALADVLPDPGAQEHERKGSQVPMTTLLGGRYRLEEEIGRGSSGTVFRGFDENLGRTVAVKRLGLAPGASDPDLRRAEREAHLAARVSHPHVVAAFDLVEDHDGHWLVMEHVEGSDLAAVVRRDGPLEPARAAAIVGQIADALCAAHEQEIVHRDVKPSNILLGVDGQAKLSDFGIARGTADPQLTRTGLVTGSPAYLAPEVAGGASATPASDVWSLGATLFHLLTGTTPYGAATGEQHVLGTLYRIVNEEPPRLPGAPWPAALLEGTLVRDPARRWTMRQLRDALLTGPAALPPLVVPSSPRHQVSGLAPAPETTSVLGVAPGVAPASTSAPDRPRRSRRPVLLAAAVAVVALVVLGSRVLPGPGADDRAAATTTSSGRTPATSPARADQPSPVAATTPSAAAMTAFARGYVRTAASDPARAFDLLTPAYQRASGGLHGYRSFWGRVAAVRWVDDVRADPSSMTVSYRYSYVLAGAGTRVETVSLQLVQDRAGGLLISGAA